MDAKRSSPPNHPASDLPLDPAVADRSPRQPRAPSNSLAYEIWLNGFFTVQEAAAERHVHTDTFKTWARKNGIKLVWLSKNRLGVRRRDALRGS
jgi:hypothetical protein